MLFRIIGGVIGALLFLWGVLPLFSGVFNVGAACLMIVGAATVTLCASSHAVSEFIRQLWQVAWGKGVLITVAALAVAMIGFFVVVSAKMITANYREPTNNATVVVLGAAVRGDQPSLSLKVRLDAAADYLMEHPAAACVVSGGRGADESCTEASVMRTYLIRKGIAPERIYSEERSTSTYENIMFSREIIQKNGLDPHMAIATQEFHQYRAQRLAEQVGVRDVGAVTAHSRIDLLGSYWLRDFFGICHMILFGE